MDKYEFNLKIEQLKKLINEEDYLTALKIVESIDWNRVRNTNLLTTAANVYEKNDLLQEAKDMLILAFERAPVGKHILFKLTELSCRTGDLEEAEDYYHEFRAADSTDIGNYTLQYMILKARHAPYDRQLMPLERYCEIDPDEKWLYELATVYENANLIDDCVRVCDRLALLYGGSKYGLKALRLKSRYANLTDTQRNILYPRSVISNPDSINAAQAGDAQESYADVYDNSQASDINGASDLGMSQQTGYEQRTQSQASVLNTAMAAPQNALNYGQAETAQQTGVYDDRDYNASSQQLINQSAYTKETETLQNSPQLDARKSDALAAERYEGEDEAFNSYVRMCASDEGRPAAAKVEVINGTANVQTQPQLAPDEGVQMTFDFRGEIPRVVDETYVQDEVNAAEQASNTAESLASTKAAMAQTAQTTAQQVSTQPQSVFSQPQAAAQGNIQQTAQPVMPGQAAGVAAANAAVNTAQNISVAAQSAAGIAGAASQMSQPVSETAAVSRLQSEATAAPQPVQTHIAEKLSQQAAQSPLGVSLSQQPTQRPLVPHQQLKSATPVKGLHMIVEAATEEDGLSIAIDELKNVHEEKGIEHASVKTSADKLNKIGINDAIISKVSGKDFVIEHAGSLNAENVERIYRFICQDKTGTIVVLIDTPDGLDRIEELEPKLFDICDYISDIDDEDEVQAKPELRVENGVTSRQTYPGSDVAETKSAEPYDDAADDDEPYDDSDDAAYDEDADEADSADDVYDEREAKAGFGRNMPETPDIEEERTPVKRSNGKVTAERFNNVKEINPTQAGQQMEIDDFAQYCVQYAASIDCSITGTSMLALYERIELMEENDIPLTKANAEQLIEEAADRAEKPPIGKRITGLFKSKYDKNGLLILKEDDFIY